MDDFKSKFLSRVTKTESGCWLWTGAARSDQYGACHFRGKVEGVHRVSYVLHIGEIPAGKIIMHTCDVRLCVNPQHLKLGTWKENWQDGVSKGRMTPRKCVVVNPLSNEQISEVVRQYEAGVSFKILSISFDIPPTSLRRMLMRNSTVYRELRLLKDQPSQSAAIDRLRTRMVAESPHGMVNGGSASQ